MNNDHVDKSAPARDPAVAETPAAPTAIRQEEQGQQSRQEVDYPAVDCGSCWYHEDALATGGK